MLATALWVALAVLAACAQPPSAPEPLPDTLLLAHFDDSMDADAAQGSPEVEVSGAELVAEGKWGGAVRLGKERYLSFDPEGNLDMAQGTLMLWLRPEWRASSAESHALLSMGLHGDPPGHRRSSAVGRNIDVADKIKRPSSRGRIPSRQMSLFAGAVSG